MDERWEMEENGAFSHLQAPQMEKPVAFDIIK